MRRLNRLWFMVAAWLIAACGPTHDNTTPPNFAEVPAAPTGVLPIPGNGGATVSWSSVSGATSYNLYWSPLSTVSVATGTKVPNVTSPYLRGSLQNGTPTYIIVTAVNAAGESAPSSVAAVTPSAPPPITTLATGASPYSDIAVDATGVYWTAADKVQKTGLDGGAVTTLASGLQLYTQSPNSIVLYAGNVYWTGTFLPNTSPVTDGAVAAVPKAGGTMQVLTLTAPMSPAGPTPYSIGLAVDASSIYWTEINGHANGNINKSGSSGGAITNLTSAGLPYFLVADSDFLYWNDIGAGTINKISKNGGSVTTLASGISYPYSVAVDGTSVYWIDTTRGTVQKTALNGGSVTTLAAGLGTGRRIIVDGQYVYWSEEGSGKIGKVPINGGEFTTLASGLNHPFSIAVDSSFVYWIEGNGAIKKVPK